MVTINCVLVLFRMLSFLLMRMLTLIPENHVKACQILGSKTMQLTCGSVLLDSIKNSK